MRFVQPALINGTVGVILAARGKLSRALTFTFKNDKVTQLDVIGDRHHGLRPDRPATVGHCGRSAGTGRRGHRWAGSGPIPPPHVLNRTNARRSESTSPYCVLHSRTSLPVPHPRRHLVAYGSANMYRPVTRSKASGNSGE
jgi:hypothetical protein